MPQIASGANATFTVPDGYVIDVQCPGGWIRLECPVGTKVFEGNPAGQTFGPYTGVSAKLTSVRGDVYYEVDPSAAGSVDASIDARKLSSGAPVVSTTGKLKTIVNSSTVTVDSGAMICTDASAGTYIVLQCDDTVQYMRAIVEWPALATGTIAMVIPDQTGTFPGMDGVGNANAGVHCVFPCWSGSAELAQVGCGGYGPDAGAISGVNTNSLLPSLAFRGNTRELELYCDKRSGRVTVQIDGQTVVDYIDTRTKNYLGKYAIFEFFGASTLKPKMRYIAASSDAKPLLRDDIPRLSDIFYSGATAIATSWTDTAITISSGNSREGTSLVMVSAWIDQTGGDTSFRLTDGTNFSAASVVARGAFSGRVTFIEKLTRSTATGAAIKLQAQNPGGTATFNAFSSVGYAQIASGALAQWVV